MTRAIGMTGNDLIKQILDKKLGDKEIFILGASQTGAINFEDKAVIDEITFENDDEEDEQYAALIINKELTD